MHLYFSLIFSSVLRARRFNSRILRKINWFGGIYLLISSGSGEDQRRTHLKFINPRGKKKGFLHHFQVKLRKKKLCNFHQTIKFPAFIKWRKDCGFNQMQTISARHSSSSSSSSQHHC